MAVSNGYFTTNNYQGRYLQFNWEIASQSIEGNYTVINWSWSGKGNASSSWYYLKNSYLNIYGARRYTQSGQKQLYNGTVVAEGNQYNNGQIIIYHDSNGNGSFSADGGGSIYTNSVNCTGRGTWELPSIPRYAVTVSEKGSDIENDTFYIGFNKYTNAFQYKLRISIPNVKELEKIDYNESWTPFTLTQASKDYILDYTKDKGNNVNLGFAVETWNGNIILSKGNEITITGVISNTQPTFSNFTFADINSTTKALTGNSAYNINGYSNIKGTISVANKAVAKKKASITKYRFTCGDKSVDIAYSSTADVGGTINGTPNGTYNMYAIDSRGNSTLVTKFASKVIEYTPLTINTTQVSAIRSNNGSGTDCTLKFSGTFWNSSFGKVTNTIKSVTYQLKKTTSSTWITGTTSVKPTVNGNTFSFSGLIRSDNIDYKWNIGDSYDIKVTVNDQLSSKTVQATLISAKPNLALAKGGVAINQAYDTTLGGDLQAGGGNVYGMKVLYDNSSGTTGTVTLSDSTLNYKYLEIFYKDSGADLSFNSIKIISPNNKRANLSIVTKADMTTTTSSGTRLNTKTIGISDKTLTNLSYEVNFVPNGIFNSNEILIVRVVGYK